MKLYHGSNCEVRHPDVTHSRRSVDFGPGFYLTSHESQALRWARRKAMRSQGSAVLNTYSLDEPRMRDFRIMQFESYGLEWLDFVCKCRQNNAWPHSFDIVVGPVADDRVFEAVNMYLQHLWDAQTTLDALAFYEKNDQYCFVTQEAVANLLQFESAIEVQL